MGQGCDKLGPYAGFFLRLAIGVVFVYHGYQKVFGGTSFGTAWNPGDMSVIVQALVAWGELLCGLAILVGFKTKIASLGIIIIMAGAIFLVHGKNGFNMMNGGFEYNYVLILASLALAGIGPGPFAIGGKCCCKKE